MGGRNPRRLRACGAPSRAYNDVMKVERTRTRLLRRGQPEREEPSPLPPAELIGVVWELTLEAYSMRGDFEPEARLQRHVVQLTRKERPLTKLQKQTE